MSEVLPIQLRPSSFATVLGQDDIIRSIRNQIASGRIPMAWLFFGEAGSGKTTLTRILAHSLQFDWPDPLQFGNLTAEHYQTQFDIRYENAAKNNGVDDIRGLIEVTRFMPVPPTRYRAIILDEAHRLTPAAQDALKTETEKSDSEHPTTIWFLLTNELSKIDAALQRRCQKYRLNPLGMYDLEQLVHRAAPTVDCRAFATTLVSNNVLSPGIALQALEMHLTGVPLEQAITANDPAVNTKAMCQALLGGNWAPIQENLKKMTSENIRQFRYGALGYLRAVVVNGVGANADRAAKLLTYLGEQAALEDAVLAPWFVGKLYQCCRHENT